MGEGAHGSSYQKFHYFTRGERWAGGLDQSKISLVRKNWGIHKGWGRGRGLGLISILIKYSKLDFQGRIF